MRGTSAILGVVMLALTLVFIGVPIVKKIQFNIGCGGYLKSAADAPTIELAKAELDTAINYLEEKGKIQGYSHLVIKNRQADVGYWYKRLKVARQDLDKVDEEDDEAAKETLRVLRESLTDTGESGTVVTTPPHIAIFPHQWLWTIFAVLGVGTGFFMVVFFGVALKE